MKRVIGATLAALVLTGAVVSADKNGKHKKHKDGKHASHSEERDDRRDDRRGGKSVDVRLVWGARDVEVIRTHYVPRYRNLPPGLAKKYARTGQLPPGWQKKMAPFPADLERRCAPLPTGYRRGVIDAHAVIYNDRGAIIDVAVLF
jgi:hypothetical protein